MNNQDFITKQVEKIKHGDTSRGSHGNLYASGDTIYSYGTHYPLAIYIKTPRGYQWIINTSGYSNTTSKHIGCAWHAVGYNAVGVELYRAWDRYETVTLEHCVNALKEQKQELLETMQTKKRKDTKVYKQLESDLSRVEQNIEKLTTK